MEDEPKRTRRASTLSAYILLTGARLHASSEAQVSPANSLK